MAGRAPRAPRSPVTREPAPEPLVGQEPVVINAHGAIEILDGPPVLEVTEESYAGRIMFCRKPFKLAGKKYARGDEVPVDLIPRVDSWVHTGFLAEKAS